MNRVSGTSGTSGTSRLTGRAFTERMNAAKDAKARERQRFPDRHPAKHEGPQLTGPKIDGRLSTDAKRPDPVADIVARSLQKMRDRSDRSDTSAPAQPVKPASASGPRQFPKARKAAPAPATPVAPPRKGVLSGVVPAAPPPTKPAA